MQLEFPNRTPISLDRPVIVGILNVTPDSFSDGGEFADVDRAVEHAVEMVRDGAGIVDIGGESTRPGSRRVDAEEQINRILPVIQKISTVMKEVAISVDTTRVEVARAALDVGACMVNDVSAGRDDPGMFELAASRCVPIVLMHMRGEPATMQQNPEYGDVVREVLAFLLERAAAAMAEGVKREQIILDPGIGFGKTTEHNLQLLASLDRFVATGFPVMLGASRKRFLGEVMGARTLAERDAATAEITARAVASGVQLIRVHEVKANRQAADRAFAAKGTKGSGGPRDQGKN